MDWLDCDIIETVPGKLSGAPVIRGTRVRPEDVVINLDELSPEEIADDFDLRVEDVREVADFWRAHQGQLAPNP
jgi:uncharacterized protein (DUF433 family)